MLAISVTLVLSNEAGDLLRLLLRDIPESDRSGEPEDPTVVDLDAVMVRRQSLLAGANDREQCRAACIEIATALDDICERHVKPEASLSRAVCYDRVDEDRLRCSERCDD